MDFDDDGWGDTDERCAECGSSDIETPDDHLGGFIYYHCHQCGYVDMG